MPMWQDHWQMMDVEVKVILTGFVQNLGADPGGGSFGQPWTTALFKHPVSRPVEIDRGGIVGDEHADPSHHGGPDKAILAYSADHHAFWRAELEAPALGPGAFGENLVVVGQSEGTACVGDLYRLGETTLEISQPRQPGWKMARRWRWAGLPRRMGAMQKTGWYLRVIRGGRVDSGDDLLLINRPFPEWTVQRAVEVLYSREKDPTDARRLVRCSALAESWKSKLAVRFKLDS